MGRRARHPSTRLRAGRRAATSSPARCHPVHRCSLQYARLNNVLAPPALPGRLPEFDRWGSVSGCGTGMRPRRPLLGEGICASFDAKRWIRLRRAAACPPVEGVGRVCGPRRTRETHVLQLERRYARVAPSAGGQAGQVRASGPGLLPRRCGGRPVAGGSGGAAGDCARRARRYTGSGTHSFQQRRSHLGWLMNQSASCAASCGSDIPSHRLCRWS